MAEQDIAGRPSSVTSEVFGDAARIAAGTGNEGALRGTLTAEQQLDLFKKRFEALGQLLGIPKENLTTLMGALSGLGADLSKKEAESQFQTFLQMMTSQGDSIRKNANRDHSQQDTFASFQSITMLGEAFCRAMGWNGVADGFKKVSDGIQSIRRDVFPNLSTLAEMRDDLRLNFPDLSRHIDSAYDTVTAETGRLPELTNSVGEDAARSGSRTPPPRIPLPAPAPAGP
jgi:hypothetical protein